MMPTIPMTGLEEAPEAWQDFILDIAQRPTDKIGCSEHVPPRSGRWLIEAYREGYVGIELDLAVRVGIGEPAYMRAVLVGTGIERGQFEITEPADRRGLDTDDRDKQFMMLVADIELVEDGEVVVRWLRSLVRLYLIENPARVLGDSGADVETDPTIAIGGRRRYQYGEARVLIGRFLSGGENELPGQVVERNAEIVDGIAKDRAHNGLDDGYRAKAEDILRSLLIAFSGNAILARSDNRAGLNIKVIQVGFRPVDSDENA